MILCCFCWQNTFKDFVIGFTAGVISGVVTSFIIGLIRKRKYRSMLALSMCAALQDISNKICDAGEAILRSNTDAGAKDAFELKVEIDRLVSLAIGTEILNSKEINVLHKIHTVHYYEVQDGRPIHGMTNYISEFSSAKQQLVAISEELKDVIVNFQKEFW